MELRIQHHILMYMSCVFIVSFLLLVLTNAHICRFVYIFIYIYIYIHTHTHVCVCVLGGVRYIGISTDYGLDDPGSNPGGDENFRPSIPTLGPTQHPVQWVPGLSRE